MTARHYGFREAMTIVCWLAGFFVSLRVLGFAIQAIWFPV